MRTLPTLLLLASFTLAQPIALRGAKIYTVTRGVIENGTIILNEGKIAAVGPAGEIRIPDDAIVRAAEGLVVIPGLVDTHSHLGVYSRPNVVANSDGNEMTGPVQSIVRAMDSIFPRDPGIRQA
ncbi:MAG: amidohydrolase, partial [Planctomycetota bacterium]|nr:amidohydrolase [Planctomycetota bacterium]